MKKYTTGVCLKSGTSLGDVISFIFVNSDNETCLEQGAGHAATSMLMAACVAKEHGGLSKCQYPKFMTGQTMLKKE